MTAGVDENIPYNNRTNPNPNSSNYYQALIVMNPHNMTPKHRSDLEKMTVRQPPMRMNANDAVANGPEDLINIYNENNQPLKEYCYKFQDDKCTWGNKCKFVHEIDPSGQAGQPRYKKDNNNYKVQQMYDRGRKRGRTPEREEHYTSSRSPPPGFHRSGPEDMKTPPGMTRDRPLKFQQSVSSSSGSLVRKPASILTKRVTTPSRALKRK